MPGLAVLRGFASARRGRSVSRCGAPGRRAARGFSANALAGPALRRRSPEALCRDLRTDAIFHPAQLSMPMQPSVSTLFRRSRLPTRLLRSSGSPAPRRGRWREKMDRDTRGAPVTPRPRHARRIRHFHSSPPFASTPVLPLLRRVPAMLHGPHLIACARLRFAPTSWGPCAVRHTHTYKGTHNDNV